MLPKIHINIFCLFSSKTKYPVKPRFTREFGGAAAVNRGGGGGGVAVKSGAVNRGITVQGNLRLSQIWPFFATFR